MRAGIMNFFQSHRGRQDFESFWVFSWRFPLDINLLLTLLPATFSPRFLYDFFWAFARLDFGGDVSCKPLRIVKSFWRKWRWVVERGISLKFSCKLYIWGWGGGGGWRFSLLACGLFESGMTLIWVWSPLSKLGKSVLSDKVDQSDYRRITVHSMKVDCRS